MEANDSICCKLCGEIYQNPVILNCGHSMCYKCAESSLSFQRMKKNENKLNCPTCSKSTEIPELGTIDKTLKFNYDLRDVIEKFKTGSNLILSNTN